MAKRRARREEDNATWTQYILRGVFFKRLGLLILKMSLGSRWLVARMWEVGPFQEHSVSSFPKMLSLDHTAARSDLDKAGPEGGCSPHSEPKGSAGHFSLCIQDHFSRLQRIRFSKMLDEMIFIPFHTALNIQVRTHSGRWFAARPLPWTVKKSCVAEPVGQPPWFQLKLACQGQLTQRGSSVKDSG